MHILDTALLCALGLTALACGPSGDAPTTGEAGSTSAVTTEPITTGSVTTGPVTTGADTTTADTTEPDPMLDYGACPGPPPLSTDAFESPDTEPFKKLLEAAIDESGYAGVAKVEHAQMIDSNAIRFCAQLSMRAHWYASTDYMCFDHGTADEMKAQFATYLAGWSPLPDTMISLAELEATVNGCFAGLYHPYVPCETGTWAPYVYQLQFTRSRWTSPCELEFDVATVDLVTGALLKCATEDGGGGCEEEG